MRYEFLVDTYPTERVKVLSVWSMFQDGDLPVRPHPTDPRGRSVLEQMVHQCVSEDLWFRSILGIDVGAPPLPDPETRLRFIRRYAEESTKRLDALRARPHDWWEAKVAFFDVGRSRAWVTVRRIAHTAHHRGQQTTLLRTGRHAGHGAPLDGLKPSQRCSTPLAARRCDTHHGLRRFDLLPPSTD